MAILSDLKEMKEALDAGLVSQAEFDDVKRDYLRAKKKALEAKEEALEFQKKELRAKEEIQKKELRAKEEALRANKEFQKKELRAKEEALEANKEFQKKELQLQNRELIAKEAFQQRKSEADLRAYALESIVKHGSSLMSEEQKVDLVRDYVRMSGLDCDVENDEPPSKRQRSSTEERDASPPQTSTPPPAAAASEDSSYSDDDGEDDYDEQKTAKRCMKKWTEEDDAALVAALRAGQKASTIEIGGRKPGNVMVYLHKARRGAKCSKALREYLASSQYVYKPRPRKSTHKQWSAEEDNTFIRAHKEGKTHPEIAAMLPGRTRDAVTARWSDAKTGRSGSAALRAYAAECCKDE